MTGAFGKTLASSERRYFCRLFVYYLIAHGGILLLLDAVYWDDWVPYLESPQTIYKTSVMAGTPYFGAINLYLATRPEWLWLSRILTFVLMFASGLLLWHIVKRVEWVSEGDRYATVMLFLVLPLNDSRAAMMLLPYTLAYFMFFLAWYLLGKSRLFALALFFLSFNINSILVFYALPMAEWYVQGGNGWRPTSAWRWLVRRIDFIALPFVFWYIQTTYFKPYGTYRDHNQHYSLINVIRSLMLIGDDIMQLNASLVLLVLFLPFAYVTLKNSDAAGGSDNRKLGLAGIAALACALFPYCVVDAAPVFTFWNSHNQLLMPLGVALLLVWSLSRVPAEARRVALALAIALSLAINVANYTLLYQDWGKKRELVSLMSRDDTIRQASVVVFDDRTELYRSLRYPFYEWNGLMILAYGNDTRFGLIPSEVESYRHGSFDSRFDLGMAWNAQHHVRETNPRTVAVTIEDVGVPSTYGKVSRFIRNQPNHKITVRVLENMRQ